jgi:hypothetical protein
LFTIHDTFEETFQAAESPSIFATIHYSIRDAVEVPKHSTIGHTYDSTHSPTNICSIAFPHLQTIYAAHNATDSEANAASVLQTHSTASSPSF